MTANRSVEFIDLGDGRTKVVVTARMLRADELVDVAKQGWSSQLDKLERLLAG